MLRYILLLRSVSFSFHSPASQSSFIADSDESLSITGMVQSVALVKIRQRKRYLRYVNVSASYIQVKVAVRQKMFLVTAQLFRYGGAQIKRGCELSSKIRYRRLNVAIRDPNYGGGYIYWICGRKRRKAPLTAELLREKSGGKRK